MPSSRHACGSPVTLAKHGCCCPARLQLWHAYLSERLTALRGLAPNHPSLEALNNTFERAMVSMHKMPRIWIMYLEFMLGQRFITRTRRLFDRALMSLPVTQHERIWPLYLRFIGQPGIPMETAVRVRAANRRWQRPTHCAPRRMPHAAAVVAACAGWLWPGCPPSFKPSSARRTPRWAAAAQVYRRYLKLEPTHAEEFIAYLKIKQLWGEAAKVGQGAQLAGGSAGMAAQCCMCGSESGAAAPSRQGWACGPARALPAPASRALAPRSSGRRRLLKPPRRGTRRSARVPPASLAAPAAAG